MTPRASLAACVASLVGVATHEVPLQEDDRRAFLAQRALGLVPLADPASFSWPGPWIAQRGGEAVVMFGVPSGVVFDPAGVGEQPIEAGWVLAPHDVALWRHAHAEPGAGVVEALVLAPAAEAPPREVPAARALPGLGLEGDRYASPPGGTFGHGRVGGALTLIDAAVVDELGLHGGAHRRNVVTRGVDVNALVGRRFRIGAVECLGQRLAEPCAHLDRLLAPTHPGTLRPLVHRAGLRADILTEGELRVGDEVVPLDVGPAA